MWGRQEDESFGPWGVTVGGSCKRWLRVGVHSPAWSSALIASKVCKGGRDEVRDDTSVTIASV